MVRAPYGTWPSPITPQLLVERVVGLSSLAADGDSLYWVESRPSEAGRQAIVRRDPDGAITDVTPAGFSARTLVHEYGGRCVEVRERTVWFSNFDDQRIYSVTDGGPPVPLTPDPPSPMAHRFADPAVTPDGRWLICVRERHEASEVVNDIVAIDTANGEDIRVLVDGHDFFAAPRLSPDGSRLAWLCWDHPNMPWDGSELWEAPLGDGALVAPARLVAGGMHESISQPRYSPDGQLHFVSDRSGWWNLFVDGPGAGASRPLVEMEAEFSSPDWTFGQCSYVFLDDGTIVASWTEDGLDRLGLIRSDGSLRRVETSISAVGALAAAGRTVFGIVGSPVDAPGVVQFSLPEGTATVLKASRAQAVDATWLSVPEPIEFPTESGLTAHALLYRPVNPGHQGRPGERPPLVVISHGGPTSATSAVLNYAIQFWTSRGFAVVDVNYGGSSGYGRAYRARLNGQWGIVDVDDCVNAARWLASKGEADERRLIIRGGSAGGYTTLCAVTFRREFACGASHYGVADARALARDTHKFESRYLDGLIGPWPEAEATYEERSPVCHTDLLATPLILFQGLEDKVVPPDQAESMVEALRAKGVPFAYIAYEGEQHGFRRAENIIRTAEAELSFYGQVFGFVPAGDIPAVPIENSAALSP